MEQEEAKPLRLRTTFTWAEGHPRTVHYYGIVEGDGIVRQMWHRREAAAQRVDDVMGQIVKFALTATIVSED